jgi:hypothetical protein
MARIPGREGAITAELREIKRRLKDLETASSLSSSAIGEGGIDVYGDGSIRSADFDGTGPEDPGTTGWWLGGENAGAVFNQLALREGIIGNDALANPVTFGQASSFQQGFESTTSDVLLAATSIPVPEGFTQAIVISTAYIGFFNTSGADTYLYVQTRIHNENAGEVPVYSNDGTWRGGTATKTKLLAGLGSSITIASVIRSLAPMPYDASARTFVEALAIFVR